MPELLTTRETAELLRCSVRTLDRERADGRGCPWVRIGGRVRYRRADVEAFVAAHVRGHAAEPAAGETVRPRLRRKLGHHVPLAERRHDR
jgi:excisionase family DNA binding protein